MEWVSPDHVFLLVLLSLFGLGGLLWPTPRIPAAFALLLKVVWLTLFAGFTIGALAYPHASHWT